MSLCSSGIHHTHPPTHTHTHPHTHTLTHTHTQTVGYDPIVPAEEAAKFNVEFMEMKDIWPIADFVTVHTPLIPATRGTFTGCTQLKLNQPYLQFGRSNFNNLNIFLKLLLSSFRWYT